MTIHIDYRNRGSHLPYAALERLIQINDMKTFTTFPDASVGSYR